MEIYIFKFKNKNVYLFFKIFIMTAVCMTYYFLNRSFNCMM